MIQSAEQLWPNNRPEDTPPNPSNTTFNYISENIKYIQNQLGHSSPTVTLNVYAHLMKPVNQESAMRLENTIFETNGSKMVAKKKKGISAISLTP